MAKNKTVASKKAIHTKATATKPAPIKAPAKAIPAKAIPAKVTSTKGASAKNAPAKATSAPAPKMQPRGKRSGGPRRRNAEDSPDLDAKPETEEGAEDTGSTSTLSWEERSQRIKDLVKLAEEQGYLTYDDINEMIPSSVINPDELEGYMELLRSMDIEIIEASDVEKYRKEPPKPATGSVARAERLDIGLGLLAHDILRVAFSVDRETPARKRERAISPYFYGVYRILTRGRDGRDLVAQGR